MNLQKLKAKTWIDKFIDTMIYIAKEVKKGDTDKFHNYSISTPRRRLDEVKAAKNRILTWMENDFNKTTQTAQINNYVIK